LGSLFFGIVIVRKLRNLRKLRAWIPALAVIVVVGFCSVTGQSIDRLMEAPDPYRLAIDRDCVGMWKEKPLLGFGWGTFSTVYPSYQSFYTDLRVNHAHNDYLELLVEAGLAGAAISLWFLVVVFREATKKIRAQMDAEGMILTVGIVAAIISFLVHSFVDFNLHIPANASLFFVLCAAAATPFRRHRGRPDGEQLLPSDECG
jgi:O-antigen ligase